MMRVVSLLGLCGVAVSQTCQIATGGVWDHSSLQCSAENAGLEGICAKACCPDPNNILLNCEGKNNGFCMQDLCPHCGGCEWRCQNAVDANLFGSCSGGRLLAGNNLCADGICTEAMCCIDQTPVPPTDAPPTDPPATPAPPTAEPTAEPTVAPATPSPDTEAPPTDAPPTNSPETNAPETAAPPTPSPTAAPPTAAPPTEAPPTLPPPTPAPPTAEPTEEPTAAPPTQPPPTNAPSRPGQGVCGDGYNPAIMKFHASVRYYSCNDTLTEGVCTVPVEDAARRCYELSSCCFIVHQDGAATAQLGGCGKPGWYENNTDITYGTCEKTPGLDRECREGYTRETASFGEATPCDASTAEYQCQMPLDAAYGNCSANGRCCGLAWVPGVPRSQAWLLFCDSSSSSSTPNVTAAPPTEQYLCSKDSDDAFWWWSWRTWWLYVAFAVLLLAAYGLYRYQMKRTATRKLGVTTAEDLAFMMTEPTDKTYERYS